jgi:hypothetical protein
VHAVRPVEFEYEPAGHARQIACAEEEENWPAGQSVHADCMVADCALPAAQLRQVDAPIAG